MVMTVSPEVFGVGISMGLGLDRPYLHVRYEPAEVTDAEEFIFVSGGAAQGRRRRPITLS
jgi:hypothetical protein